MVKVKYVNKIHRNSNVAIVTINATINKIECTSLITMVIEIILKQISVEQNGLPLYAIIMFHHNEYIM